MDIRDIDILKRLEEEENKEEDYLEYLDGEISYVKELIKRLRGNPRSKHELEFFEDDLLSLYQREEKFFIQCEKNQKKRESQRSEIRLRQQRKAIEDSKVEPKEENKIEEVIEIFAEVGTLFGCEEIDEEPIEEEIHEVHDEEELKAESHEEESVIRNELVESEHEEVEEKHEDALEVQQEENCLVPCELTFIDMVMPIAFINVQVLDFERQPSNFIPPIQEEIFEDEFVPQVLIPSLNINKIRGRIFFKEGEYDVNPASLADRFVHSRSSIRKVQVKHGLKE